MKLTIPELSFVVLVGVSGSGKSTFARKHFNPTEILSSDYCRALVSDDENCQAATRDAFEVLHFIARKRLTAGKLTVVDATNVQPESRKPLVQIAREFHCLPVAIVLDVPERVAHDRNKSRPDRDFGPHVIRQQSQQLHRSLRGLQREGFRHVHVLKSLEEIDAAVIERQPLWNNLKHEHGPFDIIGDVHGCFDELVDLLKNLGYEIATDVATDCSTERGSVTRSNVGESESKILQNVAGESAMLRLAESRSDGADSRPLLHHPQGRKLVFLGDLVDRGPKIPQVLKLVMNAVASGAALCVPGNHDMKLMRKLRGRDVQITHGLAESLAQLAAEPEEFHSRIAEFIDDLVSHYVLDDGKLVVAHAGMKEAMQGRGSGAVREFALFGETTGETDEFGLPIRYNWAAEYRGAAMVVYGHTPVPEPEWLNRTINIDTGCVFGGKLTALRYPEKELVSVPAKQTYAESRKPFLPTEVSAPVLSAQQQHDDLLDLADVIGKRIVSTRLHGNVTIREENATAALEVMSRFAANPKWLIYLPPTMSPSETSHAPGLLEHPAEAFAYFRHAGVPRVVCEEKHMGSRAVVIICRDEDAARKTFGVTDEGIGICYTRTGRRFFDDADLEKEFLNRVRVAVTTAGLWEEFKSDWFCLDCELMPWSAKAQELLKQQYAAVGTAAHASLSAEVAALEQTLARGLDVSELLARANSRRQMVNDYVEAYRRYCWPVNSVEDFKLAPFHLLASEGQVHTDKPHDWHMQTLARLSGGILIATPFRIIDVTNPQSEAEGVCWWEELTGRGGEGMVVKPLEFIVRSRRGLVQPAVKCRGREYLRIIYGPEYTADENLERLRNRGLSTKRSLGLREFALGIEALERFVRKEPLRRVHEAVFGVLALESEPVDPRL
ncbi:MAG TPA: polynucleotide kinase-phosphatase [Verrucomicrobiae bacterium]|nr:polynucleotide kinase-phosphatase [Verrucomicrobiae bacterium]